MNILLAALLTFWGSIQGNHPNVTMDQLVQASVKAKQAEIQQQQIAEQKKKEEEKKKQFAQITKTLTKNELATFKQLEPYIPDQKVDPQTDAPAVKGLYCTASTAGSDKRVGKLIDLIDHTDLNALVIDIKDDYGNITFKTDDPQLNQMDTTYAMIPDIHKLMDKLNEHHIYPIARIVTFKDSVVAPINPNWSFKEPNGQLWKTGPKEKTIFVNPYQKAVWDYNIEVAKAAAKAGFKEIQFDYVRFSESFNSQKNLTYTKDNRSHVDVIADFVKYARAQLNPLGVRISVDIFGFTTHVPAPGIGQDFDKISLSTDVISPMVYPSHYSEGWYGFKVPDANPYGTIDGAMKDAFNKFKLIKPYKPIIRPWIQDFTASWVKGHITYGKAQLDAQIKALKDNGIDQYLIWNAGNVYTQNADFGQ